MSRYGRFEIVRTKFNQSTTRQLLEILASVDWNQKAATICQELNIVAEGQNQNRFVWMVGENPSYFIQYQIDSYAMFKGYNKVILVWKPKYLEYPTLVKLTDFGHDPKIIKSMSVVVEQKTTNLDSEIQNKVIQYIRMYYGMFYFNLEEDRFEKDMLTQIKHYLSRISKQSYWHCAIDDHCRVDVSSKHNIYLRLRITGIRDSYDKDLILFSQKGVREFMLRGKSFQILSFLAMLLIFVAIISCPSGAESGMCVYKDEMILASAALMMALMGMKVVTRNKYKKKLDRKIAELEKE